MASVLSQKLTKNFLNNHKLKKNSPSNIIFGEKNFGDRVKIVNVTDVNVSGSSCLLFGFGNHILLDKLLRTSQFRNMSCQLALTSAWSHCHRCKLRAVDWGGGARGRGLPRPEMLSNATQIGFGCYVFCTGFGI